MRSLLPLLNNKMKILDVGGTYEFWTKLAIPFKNITLLNLVPSFNAGYRTVVGNGCDMDMFKDKEFDFVVSHSTIEHVGTFEDQKRMAEEIRRVGRGYYVQTPHFHIPIEPHFFLPYFQYLPRKLRIYALAYVPTVFYRHVLNLDLATQFVDSVRLLRVKEFRMLFPDAEIRTERLMGVPVAQIAIKRDG